MNLKKIAQLGRKAAEKQSLDKEAFGKLVGSGLKWLGGLNKAKPAAKALGSAKPAVKALRSATNVARPPVNAAKPSVPLAAAKSKPYVSARPRGLVSPASDRQTRQLLQGVSGAQRDGVPAAGAAGLVGGYGLAGGFNSQPSPQRNVGTPAAKNLGAATSFTRDMSTIPSTWFQNLPPAVRDQALNLKGNRNPASANSVRPPVPRMPGMATEHHHVRQPQEDVWTPTADDLWE